jgi:hypothetical protein
MGWGTPCKLEAFVVIPASNGVSSSTGTASEVIKKSRNPPRKAGQGICILLLRKVVRFDIGKQEKQSEDLTGSMNCVRKNEIR